MFYSYSTYSAILMFLAISSQTSHLLTCSRFGGHTYPSLNHGAWWSRSPCPSNTSRFDLQIVGPAKIAKSFAPGDLQPYQENPYQQAPQVRFIIKYTVLFSQSTKQKKGSAQPPNKWPHNQKFFHLSKVINLKKTVPFCEIAPLTALR